LEDARRLAAQYVEHYNNIRLHSAIGYVTPADKLAGREKEIFEKRDRKLTQARQARAQRRQAVSAAPPVPAAAAVSAPTTLIP
jgi:hypothetical protein